MYITPCLYDVNIAKNVCLIQRLEFGYKNNRAKVLPGFLFPVLFFQTTKPESAYH